MRFRIIKYYDRYKAQVFNDDKGYIDIGSPNGYYDVENAKRYCMDYKVAKETKVVEEFEL